MPDQVPEGVAVIKSLQYERIAFAAGWDDSGAACMILSVSPQEPWPWGSREPILCAIAREDMASFLGDVIEVATRVYEARHKEGD